MGDNPVTVKPAAPTVVDVQILRRADELLAVVSVLPIWKMKTALELP